jgi:hypothetical protein
MASSQSHVVSLEGVGGDSHGEEGVLLEEDVGLEVKDDQNERLDVLDGGGERMDGLT